MPLPRGVSSLGWKLLPLEQFIAGKAWRAPLRRQEESITRQPGREHEASEDTDALGQPLHLVVPGWEAPTELPVGWQPRPGQWVLCHKLLPTRIVTLVRDVPFAHLPLQLSEVQPRLVLLGGGEQGLVWVLHQGQAIAARASPPYDLPCQ